MKRKLFKVTLPGGGRCKLLTISLLTLFFACAPIGGLAQNQQNALNATGNVGVGTTTPDSKLQVNGSMSIDSSLTVRDTAIFEKQARMKDKVIVEGEAVIKGKLTARDNFRVLGTAKMEGNVKMTALPNAQADDSLFLFMDVNGKVKSGGVPELIHLLYADACVAVPQSPPGQSSLTTITPQDYIPVWASKLGVIWTGICPTKIGVGTDYPLATLDILGDARFTRNVGIGTLPNPPNSIGIALSINSSVGYAPNLLNKIGLQVDFINPSPDSDVYGIKTIVKNDGVKAMGVFNSTLNKDVFAIYGDGSFQFSNATQKILQLDANGLLRARKIKVDLNSWPDFVFGKNYILQPLSEVESYIQANGHLPNVPSAADIKESGLDLGEANRILLQKVEELTLHLIAQEKIMRQQALQLQAIQEKIKNI